MTLEAGVDQIFETGSKPDAVAEFETGIEDALDDEDAVTDSA